MVTTAMRVDLKQRIVFGFAVATIGPALGHNENVDLTTCRQVVELGNAARAGVRCRIDHPDQGFQSTPEIGNKLEKLVGFARNFRIDGNVARADCFVLPSAAAPHGDWFLALCDSDAADSFGASMVHVSSVDNDNNTRIDQLLAIDFVDMPAANPAGLFSAKFFSARDEVTTYCARRFATEPKLVACWTRNRDVKSAEYKAGFKRYVARERAWREDQGKQAAR